MRTSRLPRAVPEKAEAFLSCSSLARKLRATYLCGFDNVIGRAQPKKGFVFSDPSRCGYGWLARRHLLLNS